MKKYGIPEPEEISIVSNDIQCKIFISWGYNKAVLEIFPNSLEVWNKGCGSTYPQTLNSAFKEIVKYV